METNKSSVSTSEKVLSCRSVTILSAAMYPSLLNSHNRIYKYCWTSFEKCHDKCILLICQKTNKKNSTGELYYVSNERSNTEKSKSIKKMFVCKQFLTQSF